MPIQSGGKAILSIDGGGIRGLIPALVLEALERRLAARNKTKPLHRYLDLVVGTSTGGIIAAGLTAPHPTDAGKPAMSAAELVKLYNEYGSEIFALDKFRNLREAFLTFNIKALRQEKYSAERLEKRLDQYLGEGRLRDALANVVITAYDVGKRVTAYLRGGPDINELDRLKGDDAPPFTHADYRFREAARATSAAPTFFEPAQVSDLISGAVRTLVDGGVFANQPAICGFAQARALGWEAEDISVLSLGTGYQTREYRFEDMKDWGSLAWINPMQGAPIISILMHGQADSTDWHMQQILGERFYRLDRRLERGRGSDDMDDASDDNLKALRTLAEELIDDKGGDLDDWADMLC